MFELLASTGGLSEYTSHSTIAHLTGVKLGSIAIPLPPLTEQRRIVGILDRVASIHRLRRQAQETTRQIVPALFNQMFGDPDANPMGWPRVVVADVAIVQGGLQVTAARANLPVELPYLRVANVMRGHLDLSEIKTIRLTASEQKRTQLEQGDLLVVEGHGNPREVGRVAVWDGSLRPCVHQNHLIRVRCGDICRPQFLSAYLNSEAGRRTIIRSGKTTSGLNTISTSNVKQTEIFLPPVALQTVFEQRVGLLEQLTTHQTFAEGMGEAVAQSIRARVLGR